MAESYLRETKLDESLLNRCVKACREFHQSAKDFAAKFLNENGRHVYITPTSYLDLILTARTLLNLKQSDITTLRQRLEKINSKAFENSLHLYF